MQNNFDNPYIGDDIAPLPTRYPSPVYSTSTTTVKPPPYATPKTTIDWGKVVDTGVNVFNKVSTAVKKKKAGQNTGVVPPTIKQNTPNFPPTSPPPKKDDNTMIILGVAFAGAVFYSMNKKKKKK